MPSKKLCASMALTDTVLNIPRGIMGSFAHFHSTSRKAIKHTPPTTKNAITSGESHGVPACPPEEVGISSKITAAAPKNKPNTSILATVSFQFNLGMFVGNHIQLAANATNDNGASK